MTCVTGVSGSGKSTLVNDTIYKAVAEELNRTSRNPAPYAEIVITSYSIHYTKLYELSFITDSCRHTCTRSGSSLS